MNENGNVMDTSTLVKKSCICEMKISYFCSVFSGDQIEAWWKRREHAISYPYGISQMNESRHEGVPLVAPTAIDCECRVSSIR